MKTLFNVIRAIIYIALMFFIIPYLFYALGWMGLKAIIITNHLHSSVSVFWFWVIFPLGLITLFRLIWELFKYLAMIIIWVANLLCPYKGFMSWVIIILTVLTFLLFLYGYWSTNGWPTLLDGIVGIIISGMALSLSGIIFGTTYAALTKYTYGESNY